MKNYIMFFILVLVMVFSNYEISYSQYTGNFYFLDGTEGNEKAIMYLHITDYSAYGYYYTKSKSIEFFQYSEGFDGKNLNLEYSYYDYSIKKRIEGTIKGTLSGNIVFIGEHNSKSVNLSLANMPVNSARLEENYDENYYSNYADSNYGDIKFIFNIKTLNKLDDDYHYGYIHEIAYLDKNIIIFSADKFADLDVYLAYSINTGKKINLLDYVSNSLIQEYKLEYVEDGRFYRITDNKLFFMNLVKENLWNLH